MAEAFLRLSTQDRRDALEVAASAGGQPVHLLEKDVWVVWTLAALFASPIGEHLVFKGGTSLSKAYAAIRRFSEDIDLTYDIRRLIPDLVADRAEALPPNRSQEKKWTRAVRSRLPEWITTTVVPELQTAMDRERLPATLRSEEEKVFIDYKPLAKDAEGRAVEYEAAVTGAPRPGRSGSGGACGRLPAHGRRRTAARRCGSL
jgi:hypothetical protein